ncbi:MAG: hypothetical protein EAZ37_00900 [Burkholderiales bacterium]|nr:MAG: hypothetical protein EAZ37_00900 [Burkholderiales bacterium]
MYSHLDYPFDLDEAPPVQLQGIGISLINALCSELTVIVQKHDVTVRLSFRHRHLSGHETLAVTSPTTGNSVMGTVDAKLQMRAIDGDSLRNWCQSILAVSPGLTLFYNDVKVSA